MNETRKGKYRIKSIAHIQISNFTKFQFQGRDGASVVSPGDTKYC